MEILQAVLLGIVQGIGEFLPISSSGHLVITGDLLDRVMNTTSTPDERLLLNVTLHAGTLLSILIIFRREILIALGQPRLLLLLALASVPAGAIGLTFKDLFKTVFSTPLIAGLGLFVTAVVLVVGHRLERSERSCEQLTWTQALLIGLFQACALVPGISRSGSTISGGLLTGLKRESAATFSFLMAIPVIGGATLLEARSLLTGEIQVESPIPLVCGGLTAFVVGLFTLRWLLRLVSRGRLYWFSYYCVAVGTATVVWQLVAAVLSGT